MDVLVCMEQSGVCIERHALSSVTSNGMHGTLCMEQCHIIGSISWSSVPESVTWSSVHFKHCHGAVWSKAVY
jgi:hypothetical protein